MPLNSPATYPLQILPALRRIQEKHGYLMREDLERFSKESGIPLYRLQEVATFFPHFHLEPPKRVVVKVCRDMACHMAGSAALIEQLSGVGADVSVQGVSCVGRCDRPPAVCVAIQGTSERAHQSVNGAPSAMKDHEHEFYVLGRSADELKRIIRASVQDASVNGHADRDVDQSRYPAANWLIDPYKGAQSNYDAVKKVVAERDRGLQVAAEALSNDLNLPRQELVERLRGLRQAPAEADAKAPEPKWVADVLTELDAEHADLRGLGGAGYSAAQKWRDVRQAMAKARSRRMDTPAVVVVNGDESEPATFKDRELLLHFPHLIVEAVILAGLITDASEGFIYIRHEYHEQIAACDREIRRAEALGVCGENASVLGRSFPVSVFVSPGGYICGEQSALIEAMSDHRGEPRNVPPQLQTNGLQDRPTLLSNVETYAWVPYIVLKGGDNYARLGVNEWKGRRFFSVCGDVVRPGVYEVPMGLTLRELIHGAEYCQGIVGNRKLKAIAPSGPSGGFLPTRIAVANFPKTDETMPLWQKLAERRGFDPAAQELDVLDLELELALFRALSPTAMLGAGLAVYAEGRDMAEQTANSVQFYRNESCGKCVPCRVGSQKLANLFTNLIAGRIDAVTWRDEVTPMVNELSDVLNLASICGLGRSVPIPIRTAINFFGADLAAHLT
jgi:formate dehydrogenase beta subunit